LRVSDPDEELPPETDETVTDGTTAVPLETQTEPVAMATAAEPRTSAHTVSVPGPPPVEDVKNKKGN